MGDKEISILAQEILETLRQEDNEVKKTKNGFIQRIKAKDFLARYKE